MTARNYKRTITEGAIVITGASTGIGEVCAVRMAKLGFQVFAGVRKEADGEALRRQAPGQIIPLILDVTDRKHIAEAVQIVQAALGDKKLIGVVNNAGIGIAGPLEFMPLDDMRQQLEVNVIAHLAVTQAFLPLLRQSQGRVVNIGSIMGLMSMPLVGPYAATKFAMEALTDTLRMELLPWGIGVSIVEAGNIKTPIWEKTKKAALERLAKLPEQATTHYGQLVNDMLEYSEFAAKTGTPPEKIANVIEHALTAAKPKTRYLAGSQSQVQRLVRLLPDQWRDRLLLNLLRRMSKA
jgi:NAD(P)-dependent dehydrogenase (short-subunit alcohol dehydrogenase family)